MKRFGKEQGAHDKKVHQIARKLTSQNWRVKADISGYEKPRPIGKDKRIPDIEATKQGHRRLIEIETPEVSLQQEKEEADCWSQRVVMRSGIALKS